MAEQKNSGKAKQSDDFRVYTLSQVSHANLAIINILFLCIIFCIFLYVLSTILNIFIPYSELAYAGATVISLLITFDTYIKIIRESV